MVKLKVKAMRHGAQPDTGLINLPRELIGSEVLLVYRVVDGKPVPKWVNRG